jgi:hypothetical protein
MHLVMQGGSLGGGVVWVGGVNVGHLKKVLPSLGCHRFLPSTFLFLHVTVHVIGLLVFATVFWDAFAFNGDLNLWNVAKLTDTSGSKSIRIV